MEHLIAWAAGLFEGEGHANCNAAPRLKMDMTDLDVLQRFQSVVGGGRIIGPRKFTDRKPIWTWYANSEEAQRIGYQLLPWLCQRRAEQLSIVFAWKRKRRLVAECGTRGGYRHHYKHGETPCLPCVRAERSWQKQYKRDNRKAG